MEPWVLGNKRNVYTEVSAALGPDPTISNATYEVFDISDETAIASGDASVSSLIVFFMFEPTSTGTYVARIHYNIGDEKYDSDQVIEVRETM